jgi:hypothetical protein
MNTNSNKGRSYILTTTDYFKKWQEVVTMKKVDYEELITFLKNNIFSVFGVAKKLITDKGLIFIGSKINKKLWGI